MIKIPYADALKWIASGANLSEGDVEVKIKEKMGQLSGLISKDGAAYIVANELGVKLFDVAEKLKVRNLNPGLRNVGITLKLLALYDIREFSRGDGTPGTVASALAGDETGTLRIVAWGPATQLLHGLQVGMTVALTSGLIKENNTGHLEIHLNERSTITLSTETIDVQPLPREERKNIKDVQEGQKVELLGTIIQLFDPKFFETCPACRKRAKEENGQWMCPAHGVVQPVYSYVFNVYIDDGSDNIRCVLFKEQIEQLLGVTTAKMLEYKEHPELFESVKTDLLGKIVKLSGTVKRNEFFDRVELITSRVDANPNPEEEMKKLDASQEGTPAV